MLPMILKGVLSPSERKARAELVLRQVGMGHRLNHYPSMLSGGEQQRVTIARAIGNQPDLLLLDEPTGDLDIVNSNAVVRLLLDLNIDDGITLIMVTHDVNLKAFADRVIWMRDGKISRVEVTPPDRKAAAIAQLDADIAAAAAAAAAVDAESDKPAAGGATSAPTANTPVTYANTTVRMPSYYAPVRHVRTRKGKRRLAKQLALAGVADSELDLPSVGAAPRQQREQRPRPDAGPIHPPADFPIDASSSYSFYSYEEQAEDALVRTAGSWDKQCVDSARQAAMEAAQSRGTPQ
ncbi:uncharacterized protein AMSG_12106 [Thecamonas trahens ATCC 50062]|uniref:ABC transporter domain-containing protein n=1 Tax=Thecamonas trahens ATCC 50062 TaxID=461836 RepID=A0A0L0DK96_THETB|nr:hypothetical protein AMSG_12106 [Thecamonas trahens ATCC 50062]KNC51788.1 hypothetical protein AMSG_12106 [Thecamonas trahens ATCC 50062]|eukprot:XP_013755764.1 hypothetical protein AMSG_12106 [Thecamonas trahens ATCC 50062]